MHESSYDWKFILRQIRLSGMVYLANFGRDCGILTAQDFSDFLNRWPIEWNPYQFGQSRRVKLAGQVYTASEYNRSRLIPTHHELSYTSQSPRWIVFYAHQSVDTGSMRVLDGKRLYLTLKKSVWNDVLGREIVYRKCMPSEKRFGFGKTWQAHFENTDAIEVTNLLEEKCVKHEWLPNGDLTIEYRRPFTREHSVGTVWYAQPRLWELSYRGLDWFERTMENQYWPTDVILGNETRIPKEFLQWLDAQENRLSNRVHLATGGLLIVDNHRIAHGREPYQGDRQHWVSMGN